MRRFTVHPKTIRAASMRNKDVRAEIYEYLDECFYCSDYNQAVEDVMDQWNLTQEEAESYVWNWTIRPAR